MSASLNSSTVSMSQVVPLGTDAGVQLSLDPVLFIDCSGEHMELTMDSIVALQTNSSKRVEAITFLSNHVVSEAEIIKGVVHQ